MLFGATRRARSTKGSRHEMNGEVASHLLEWNQRMISRSARVMQCAVALAFTSWLTGISLAATTAFDDASQVVYDDGWQTGDNGGAGWGGGWIVDSGGFGVRSYLLGDSDSNGSGAGPGIDTPTDVGRSWGIRASNSPQSQGAAIRAFNGILSVGQTLRLALDHGTLAPGPADGVMGFGIRSGATNVFEFLGTSVSSVYLYSDQIGFHSSTVPLTTGGVDLQFKLTGPTTYSLMIANRDGSGSQLLNGTFGPFGLSALRVFNFRAGNAIPASDAFFNRIAIVTLAGDYNDDGEVNAADYVIWRKYEGTTNHLLNDLIGGEIGQAQSDQWVTHFGEPGGAGTGSVEESPSQTTVPEPSPIVLSGLGVVVMSLVRRHVTAPTLERHLAR